MTLAEQAVACLAYDGAGTTACTEWAASPVERQLELLKWADYTGASLYLWRAAERHRVKPAHAAEYAERLHKNVIRLVRRKEMAAELTALFHRAGLPFAIIKGFFLAPGFVPFAEDRQQNDIDLLLSTADAHAAFDLLRRAGYWTRDRQEADGPAVHLPMLFPPNFIDRGGDFYNPATPAVVELHDRLWPSEFERIPLEFTPDPLTRVVLRDGLPSLHPLDQLAACALHAMRHVFRGSLRISHLYELAGFLENNLRNGVFWNEWIHEVNPPVRTLSNAALALAASVFRARWPAALDGDRAELGPANDWIARYGSTVIDNERADKSRVFLQLGFVHGWRNKLVVLQRRLAPVRIPVVYDQTPRQRAAFLVQRTIFHIIAFFRLIAGLLR